jgi:hypothetical protein
MSLEEAIATVQPIGGYDLILRNLPGAEGLDHAVRCILLHWGCAIVENDLTGEIYPYHAISFGDAKGLFVYVDDNERHRQHLYLIAGLALTVVVADPNDPQVAPVITSLRSAKLP